MDKIGLMIYLEDKKIPINRVTIECIYNGYEKAKDQDKYMNLFLNMVDYYADELEIPVNDISNGAIESFVNIIKDLKTL